jgi:hypothetical protein
MEFALILGLILTNKTFSAFLSTIVLKICLGAASIHNIHSPKFPNIIFSKLNRHKKLVRSFLRLTFFENKSFDCTFKKKVAHSNWGVFSLFF